MKSDKGVTVTKSSLKKFSLVGEVIKGKKTSYKVVTKIEKSYSSNSFFASSFKTRVASTDVVKVIGAIKKSTVKKLKCTYSYRIYCILLNNCTDPY